MALMDNAYVMFVPMSLGPRRQTDQHALVHKNGKYAQMDRHRLLEATVTAIHVRLECVHDYSGHWMRSVR